MDYEKAVDDLGKFLKEMNIPFYVVGCVDKKPGEMVIEVVLQRPEKYTMPGITEKIPTEFQGFKVVVV